MLAWTAVLAALTSLAVLWLTKAGVNPTTDFSPAVLLVAYSPTLAAILVATVLQGFKGQDWLWRQLAHWRVALTWYAIALFGPLVLVFVANAVYIYLGGSGPTSWWDFSQIGGWLGPLVAGALGEEIGWRGFAQPLLQRRYSILWASIIVGLLWATWHLYPLLAPGGSEQLTALNITETYVRLVSTAVLYGWLYNATRGSLLVVMLAHVGHNLAVDLMPATTGSGLLIVAMYLLAAISLIWATKGKLATKKS